MLELTFSSVAMKYCCHVWAGASSCYLELLDKLQKRIYRTVDLSLAASLEPLAHRRNLIEKIEIFFFFFFAALLADNMARISEVYSEPCQTSKMEYFAKIVTVVGR